MRAILIQKAGSYEIIEIPVPVPGDDEILVEMKALSLCNQHDWKVNRNLYHDLIYLEYGVPGFPGHEGAGIVVKTGAKVKNLKPGDHVVLSGLGGPPLYAEYVTRQAQCAVKVAPNIPFPQVAMAELFGCILRACQKVSTYRDKTVAISGCGPGGLAALQLCKAAGAGQIMALDVLADRLQLAAELGANQVIDARNSNEIKQLQDTGADIVIECSGNKQACQNAIRIARESVVFFGYNEGTLELPLWPMFDHELTLYNSKWLTTENLQTVVNMIENGIIRTDNMISVQIDFEHYPDAVEMIGRGEIIKAIMIPSQ